MGRAKTSLNYIDDPDGYTRFVRGLLLVLVLLAAAVLLGALLGGVREWPRYGYVAGVVLTAVLGYSMLQRRGPAQATGAVACGLWLLVSLNMLQYAGVHSASLLIYPFLIGLAGWVLGPRWLIAMSAASLAWVLFLGLGEQFGGLHPTPRAATLLVMLQQLAVLTVSALLIHAAHRSLRNSRDRAFQLSAALALEHDAVLQRERELLQLMDTVPAGVASFDAASRVRRCNVRYAALFGAKPDQLLGRCIDDFVPEEALRQVRAHWSQALAGQPRNYRRSNRDPASGALEWLDVSLLPDLDEQGSTIGVFALLVDVTARVQAEREVLALNAELERRVDQRGSELAEAMEKLEDTRRELQQVQASSTLSVLVAKMSHELASPVGNSRLLADTFLHWLRDFEQQLAAGQLRKSALVKLLKDLGDGSRQMQLNLAAADELMRHFKQLSADQASGQRRRFELDELVREVLASMAPMLRRSGHEVKLELPKELGMDSLPGPLGQVLINLINNALIHGLDGRSKGEITITATPSTDGQRVSLSVADNGRGIPPEAIPELFKPFYSTRIGQGGSGLGLPIVEDIVCKRLGGSISVSSEPGQGSRFTLDLPLRLAAA